MELKITTIIQKSPEGGYIGFIEEIPGINTQGETLKEVRANLIDALNFSLEYHREKAEKLIGKNNKGIYREEFNLVTL